MGSLSVWHWVVVLVVLVLLFGSKRLPDAARGLGRSLRILKSEVRQMNSEDGDEAKPEGQAPAQGPASGGEGRTAPAAPAQQALAAAPSQQANEQASHATTA
ncbi:Sec-independent protein translocase subunit TatA [Segniliparus rugosus]|uniref:Sec-independent protein translocase protein TatA n=1 Tax=Segniliparus rugosus (strain ATCC BAA-974 / DSM 45345 / CCUG 50838 / CIP 108380 / JCM 13579 / CDC 945) TaxID=679197 RepID=E5XT03_SEGRC|nr:Sec-independent protein translocase subunit TatA [Segniliparus rugosus]EFV12545.1 TatA/E family twin arginine-targeting protein translocase [Segniliparus rugosus ATCC BAA-974]